ncbi:hypothetical protein LguiB_000231 [Lonicera macranthoides]
MASFFLRINSSDFSSTLHKCHTFLGGPFVLSLPILFSIFFSPFRSSLLPLIITPLLSPFSVNVLEMRACESVFS